MQPRMVTHQEDIQSFQAERAVFLDEQRRFKFGSPAHGLAAFNTLKSMYMCLLFSLHQQKSKDDSNTYINDINAARGLMHSYIVSFSQNKKEFDNTAGHLARKNYVFLINKLDELIADFYIIKREVGV